MVASQYPWYLANANPDPPVSEGREKLVFFGRRQNERGMGVSENKTESIDKT